MGMVQRNILEQYLTSVKISTTAIHWLRISAFKNLTMLTFNIFSSADTNANADANADTLVTAIALPVLLYRRANKETDLWNFFNFVIFFEHRCLQLMEYQKQFFDRQWHKVFGLVWFIFYGPSTCFRSFRARSVNLATLFLGKPPRQFTST